ncbi:MerR family transcriptional regulator [Celeribacter baekdonensis]|uniref:MerR family transcriptional regulator n=1 Tax=Celeribacter baekdonensis TaxID=875171 RepID=UPI003A93E977
MRISEAAEMAGLTADTIRFYERVGLLDRIPRGSDGHRDFGAQELRWLRLFERLRSTGMPLTEMKQYAALARQGEGTYSAREAILARHRSRLDEQQAKIETCRHLIEEKISTYRRLAQDKTSTDRSGST